MKSNARILMLLLFSFMITSTITQQCINSACVQCQVGSWSIGNAACTPCVSPLIKSCDSMTGLATACTGGNGFSLSSGSCTPCPPGAFSNGYAPCALCISTAVTTCDIVLGTITGCAFNYNLLNGSCVSTASYTGCSDLHAQSCDSLSLVTRSCNAGYTLSSNNTCVACLAGTFSTKNSPSCMVCSPGQFSGLAASSSSICPANTKSNAASSTCTACPIGQASVPGSSSCVLCSNGYYPNSLGKCSPTCGSGFGVLNATCSACMPGSSSSAGSTSPCTTCLAGQYAGAQASTCSPCATNSFSSTGSSTCTPCRFGQTSTVGSPTCSVCSAGTYENVNGTCSTCLGTGIATCGPILNTANTCTAGYGLMNGTCTGCSTGFFSAGVVSACLICPINQFSGTLAGACSNCPNNNVPTALGSSCMLCPAGQSTSNGSTGCVTCTAGSYLNSAGTCVSCLTAGTLTCGPVTNISLSCSPGYGLVNGTCIACLAGTSSTGFNATCLNCLAGASSLAIAGNCTLCKINTFSSAAAPICRNCTGGQTSIAGSTSCAACGVGLYYHSGVCSSCMSTGIATCGPLTNTANTCNTGYGLANSTCTACTNGTFSLGLTAACTICPAGQSSVAQASSCSPCPTNMYSSPITGLCMSCLVNGVATCGPLSITANTCLIGFGMLNSTCTKCLTGGNSTIPCNVCPAGKVIGPGAKACVPGTTVGCKDTKAYSCSTSNLAFTISCLSFYSLVGGVCQPYQWARFLNWSPITGDIDGQSNTYNATEASCYQYCASLNPLNGGFSAISFQLIPGSPSCSCKSGASTAFSTMNDYSNFYTSSLVGSCALYASQLPNNQCQNVFYNSTGCIGVDGSPCTVGTSIGCSDPNVNTCDSLHLNIALNCLPGYGMAQGNCSACPLNTLSTTSAIQPCQACDTGYFSNLASSACIQGTTLGCTDTNAGSCALSDSSSTINCIPFYLLVKNICQPFYFARFLNWGAVGGDIQGQFDGVNTTEILCYQNCVRLNTLTGIFTTLSFQLEDGNPGCWCKTNAANAYSTLSDYSTLFTTSLVGSCASYSTNLPNNACQNVIYTASGCIGLDGSPCTTQSTTCSDPNANTCDSLSPSTSLNCVPGYGLAKGVCSICPMDFYSTTSAVMPCQPCSNTTVSTPGSSFCVSGQTTGCTDQFAHSCTTDPTVTVYCVQFYSLVNQVCQPYLFARFLNYGASGGDIEDQFNSMNATEALCYQNCQNLNVGSAHGLFTSISFQLEVGNQACWCKTSAASAYLNLLDYSDSFTTSLVGNCSTYAAHLPNLQCQNIMYTSTGCIGVDGSPCTIQSTTCSDSNANTCDSLSPAISINCDPGYGMIKGICTACPAGSYSTTSAIHPCRLCATGYVSSLASSDCVPRGSLNKRKSTELQMRSSKQYTVTTTCMEDDLLLGHHC